MGRHFASPQVRTPAGRVRETLLEAERLMPNLRGAGAGALELLHLLDQTAEALAALEVSGVDVRAEQARFEAVQQKLRRNQARFLAEVGVTFPERRAAVQPDRARWWWFLDETLAQERRQRLRRVMVWCAAAISALAAAWLVYDRFLAPPPEVRRALRGESLAMEGDLQAAFAEFEAAAALAPSDPEYHLWLGVIHFELNELDQADREFETARALYETDFDFLLRRGEQFFRVGDLTQASIDVERAIQERPESAGGYALRAGIAEGRGDCAAAIADLERVVGLARAAGEVWLEGEASVRLAMIMQSCQPLTPTLDEREEEANDA